MVQLGIGGLIDLAHAPLADEGGDIVMGDAGADVQGHRQCRMYRRRSEVILCPTGQSLHSPAQNARESVARRESAGKGQHSHMKALVVPVEHVPHGALESFPPLA